MSSTTLLSALLVPVSCNSVPTSGDDTSICEPTSVSGASATAAQTRKKLIGEEAGGFGRTLVPVPTRMVLNLALSCKGLMLLTYKHCQPQQTRSHNAEDMLDRRLFSGYQYVEKMLPVLDSSLKQDRTIGRFIEKCSCFPARFGPTSWELPSIPLASQIHSCG